MQIALVAGGAGFIGSNLCRRLLNDNYRVICVDSFLTGTRKNIEALKSNERFTLLEHDVTKPLPNTVKADAVFHLASPASPNHHSKLSYHALPLETMMANTTATFELLSFSEKAKAKFLFASTSEVYGDPLEHPQKESYRGNVSTTGPRSVYDEAKRFGETITAYFWREKDVNGRIARIFNTYGPDMLIEDKRMVIRFITQALENQPITVFGDGSQTRSLCFIDDMVEGLMRLMFYPNTKSEIVNLGAFEEHSVLEYATIIKRLVGSKSEIVFTEKLPIDDPKKRRPDVSHAKELLDWEPVTGLEEGLAKLIASLQTQ